MDQMPELNSGMMAKIVFELFPLRDSRSLIFKNRVHMAEVAGSDRRDGYNVHPCTNRIKHESHSAFLLAWLTLQSFAYAAVSVRSAGTQRHCPSTKLKTHRVEEHGRRNVKFDEFGIRFAHHG